MAKKVHRLEGKNISSGIPTISSPELSQRYNYSIQHMKAAGLLCRQSYQIEEEHKGEKLSNFFDDIRSYVTASVILTAAALEAKINENFLNIRDGILTIENFDTPEFLRSKEDKEKYKREWLKFEKKPTLKKYKEFSKFAHHEITKEEEKEKEFKDVEKLLKFRNEFVHYKPEWDDEKSYSEMEEICREFNGVISFSPFIEETAPYFPMRCMCYSLAQWGINVVVDFTKWFDDIVGIEDNFEEYRTHFNLEP